MKQRQSCTLQVIIASGPEAIGRAVLGFAFALSAAISGVKVMVILALQGVAWAEQNIPAAGQSVNGFAPIREYIDMLKDNGAIVRLCSSCVENNCTIDKAEKNTAATGTYVGLTEVAIRATRGKTETIIF
jgi:predicted peroxiredoxin